MGSAVLVVAVVASRASVVVELPEILVWIAAAILADAIAVRITPSATLSMSMTVTLGAALVLSPASAAVAAFLGTWSRGEIRKRDVLASVFNRVEVALATLCASAVLHYLGADPMDWPLVLLLALVALATDAVVNVTLIVPWTCLADGLRPKAALKGLFGARPTHNALIYASAAVTSPILALCYVSAGAWGLAAALSVVTLSGVTLAESQKMAGLSERLASKDLAIRQATDQIVSERRHERTSVAGELHDEVLPALFKVHLMGQVVRHDLASGRLLELEEDVSSLVEATDIAQSSIREVVGDLRTSTLGPEGLLGAVRHLAEQLDALSAPPIELELEPVPASERSELVAFQVIREALTNSAKYSGASRIRVTVSGEGNLLRVLVADDGSGFDPSAEVAGHYGLLLMRERVEAVGGSFDLHATLGNGVVVSAAIPVDA